MHINDGACKAMTALVRSLAKGDHQAFDDEAISLPGADTAEKKELERELKSLLLRVRQLETRAAGSNCQTFPETPNEFVAPASPFSMASVGSNRHPSPVPLALTGRAGSPGSEASDQSQLEYLQAKCKYHEQEIQENKKKLRDLLQETERVKTVPQVPADEASNIDRLQRELKKSQQANEAFSKALREIGEIVTAGMLSTGCTTFHVGEGKGNFADYHATVARGDLTKKVTIHDVEMDPEITTFKNTINTMTDQLQTFASEVSRVAREVGTEGRLGGQAKIVGVEGTWQELTNNGKHHP